MQAHSLALISWRNIKIYNRAVTLQDMRATFPARMKT